MKLIDKAAVVAEINELLFNLSDSDFDRGYLCAMDTIIALLDTLEAKEVSNPLTWEDVRLLDFLSIKVDVHCNLEEKEHYEEILKQFKAQKGEEV